MRRIRISELFGAYHVEGLDDNGVWVSIEPGSDEFDSREEAQDYVDGWLNASEGYVQCEGLVK